MILADQRHAPARGDVGLLVNEHGSRLLRRPQRIQHVVKLCERQILVPRQHLLPQGVELLGNVADSVLESAIGRDGEGEGIKANLVLIARIVPGTLSTTSTQRPERVRSARQDSQHPRILGSNSNDGPIDYQSSRIHEGEDGVGRCFRCHDVAGQRAS
jgi:hypothetical protein